MKAQEAGLLTLEVGGPASFAFSPNVPTFAKAHRFGERQPAAMTMQPSDAITFERESSEEAAPIQEEQQAPQPQQQQGEDPETFFRRLYREEHEQERRRSQSANAKLTNEIRDLKAQLADIRAMVGDTPEVRAMLSDLHELSVDEDTRNKRKLERDIAKLQQQVTAAQHPAPTPAPEADDDDPPTRGGRQFTREEFNDEFSGEGGVISRLQEWAEARGVPEPELQANFQRFTAAVLPGGNLGANRAAFNAYEKAMRQQITEYARQKHNAGRQPARTAQVQTGGGRREPDAEYRNALARGEKLPSSAEIDAMTAKYLREG